MNTRIVVRMALIAVAILTGLGNVAHAGPPLICHPIEIGKAKSLPVLDWNEKGTGDYEVKNLVRDTLAILDSSSSVLVRMETLRRATIYARHDPQSARELLARLHARADESDKSGHSDALAWFDTGYLVETYKQWLGSGEPNPALGLDGYGFVKKAIHLRGEDPEMEFAAALISLTEPGNDHDKHLQKAKAGAQNDPLLAQNLASHVRGEKRSALLAGTPAPGAKQ